MIGCLKMAANWEAHISSFILPYSHSSSAPQNKMEVARPKKKTKAKKKTRKVVGKD